MSISHGYASLDDLKERLDITDTDDDYILEAVIEAASRAIDAYTGRRFWSTTASSDDETRYYTAEVDDVLFPDDLQSVTGFWTDEDETRAWSTTWSSTDYELLPYNATLDGHPYTRIELAPDADHDFCAGLRKGVKITGSFGYCAGDDNTPKVVTQACLLQSARLFKRKDAPFGVAGTPELGMLRLESELDPDVRLMLAGVRRVI